MWQPDYSNERVLEAALYRGDARTILRCLRAGQNLNTLQLDEFGQNLFMNSFGIPDTEILQCFNSFIAFKDYLDLEAKSLDKRNALMFAAVNGHFQGVHTLIQCGVNLN